MLTQLPLIVLELIADMIVGENDYVEEECMPARIAECNALSRDILALGVCVGMRFNLQLLRLFDMTKLHLDINMSDMHRVIHRIVNANNHSIVHKEFVEIQCCNVRVGEFGGRSIDSNNFDTMYEYMELCPEVYRNRMTFLSMCYDNVHDDDPIRIINHIRMIIAMYTDEEAINYEELYHLTIYEGRVCNTRTSYALGKIFHQLAHTQCIELPKTDKS